MLATVLLKLLHEFIFKQNFKKLTSLFPDASNSTTIYSPLNSIVKTKEEIMHPSEKKKIQGKHERNILVETNKKNKKKISLS